MTGDRYRDALAAERCRCRCGPGEDTHHVAHLRHPNGTVMAVAGHTSHALPSVFTRELLRLHDEARAL